MENQENNNPPFSETSLDFTEPTAKISLGNSSSWAFEYEDFTIESWVYCKDLAENGTYLNDKAIFGSMTADRYKQQFLFYVRYNGTLCFWNGHTAVGGGKLENDTWHHIAMVRRNLRVYMYLDGKLVYNGCEDSRFRQTSNFAVGAVYDPYVSSSNKWTRYFDGYMQDLRVIKDFAAYTCNFVPSKKLLELCPKSERCPAPPEKCLLYISYEFNMPWYMGGSYGTNTHVIEIEKNKAPFQTSHIFMTTQKRYYGPGTNTSSIRNVKIKASNDTDWAVVEVNLDTRHEETYSRNSAYTAISFNLTIPSVLDNCTHIFENPTPTPEPWPWPTPTPIPEGGEVIRIIQPPSPEIPDTEPEVEILNSDNPPVSEVYGVSANAVGQLGGGTDSTGENQPQNLQISPEILFAKIKGGENHTLMLTQDGQLYGMGSNAEGQLGKDIQTKTNEPTLITEGVLDFDVGFKNSLILLSDGHLYALGLNQHGSLGLGTTEKVNTLTKVKEDVNRFSMGAFHSMLTLEDGSLWVTGRNKYGQLGTGNETDLNTFTKVLDSNVTQISLGTFHSMILKSDGSVWMSGDDSFGQFGRGNKDNWTIWENTENISFDTLDESAENYFTEIKSSTFIKVIDSDVISITAGAIQSFAFKNNQGLYSTGLKSLDNWMEFSKMYNNDGGYHHNYLIGYLVPEFQNVSEFTLVGYDFQKVLSEVEYTDEILKFIRDYYRSSSEEQIKLDRFNLLLHKNKKLYGMGLVINNKRLSYRDSFYEYYDDDAGAYAAYMAENFGARVVENNVNLVGIGKDTYFVKRTNQETNYKLDLSDDDIEIFTTKNNTFAKTGSGSTSSFSGLLSKVSVNQNISYVFSRGPGTIFVYADGSVHGAGSDFWPNYGFYNYAGPEKNVHFKNLGFFEAMEIQNPENIIENWTKTFKDKQEFNLATYELLSAPTSDDLKWIKVEYSSSHVIFLNAKGEIYGAGDNQQGQLGLQKGSVTEKFQKTRDGIRNFFFLFDITYAITSGNTLVKFTTDQDQVIAENVLKFTLGGYITLDNQFKKIDNDNTLISDDVVDAVFSTFWLKSDGSLYYRRTYNQVTQDHLVVKDDTIESLYYDGGHLVLKNDGSVWKLNGNPTDGYNLDSFIESGVTYINSGFYIRNNAHLAPKFIEFTPTPTFFTPTPTQTPGPYLVGKGRGPLGDNTLSYREDFVDILRGENIKDMHHGTGITLTISENGDVYGWKNTATNNYTINTWGYPSSNFSDPFQPKSFSSAFFTDGLTYKPSKAKIGNVDKFLTTATTDLFVYKDSDGNVNLYGKYGTYDTKTDNNDLPKVLTDVEDVKGNVFLLKDGTLNLSYAIGGITPIAIDTNVSKLIGNLSMTTTDPNVDHSGDRYHYGVQYIKGDNLMYARRDWELGVGQKDSFILHNFGAHENVIEVSNAAHYSLRVYLSSDGTLFSKYTSTRHGSTRTTTYNFKAFWTDSAMTTNHSWGSYNYTRVHSDIKKIVWATDVDSIRSDGRILMKNGDVRSFTTKRSEYYYLSGATVTYSLSNRVNITFGEDVTRQFRIGNATYNYYE